MQIEENQVLEAPASNVNIIKDQSASQKKIVKADLNHHLHRVMKLIKTREDVTRTGNGQDSPDLAVDQNRKQALAVDTGPFQINSQDKPQIQKNLKRSVTSLSQEQLQKSSGSKNETKEHQSALIQDQLEQVSQSRNRRHTSQRQQQYVMEHQQQHNQGIEKRLGKLRIVKSIHTRVNSEDANDRVPVKEESANSGLFSSENLTPMQPLGYFSRQQKRSFVPADPTELVLEGTVKPKNNRNRIRKNIRYNEKVLAREFGCQTTPNLPKNSSEDETDKKDIASTQLISLADQDEHLNSQIQQVQAVNKINFRSGSNLRSSESKVRCNSQQSSSQQQKMFKMSLLKSTQAQANEKFFFRNDNSMSQDRGHVGGVYSTKNSVSMSQAFMSQSQIQAANALSRSVMHTAMRVTQRQNKITDKLKSNKDAELVQYQDLFSWGNQTTDHMSKSPPNSNSGTRGSNMRRHPQQQFYNHERQRTFLNSQQAVSRNNYAIKQQMLRKTQQIASRGQTRAKIVSNHEFHSNNVRAEKYHKTQPYFFGKSQREVDGRGAEVEDVVENTQKRIDFLKSDNSQFDDVRSAGPSPTHINKISTSFDQKLSKKMLIDEKAPLSNGPSNQSNDLVEDAERQFTVQEEEEPGTGKKGGDKSQDEKHQRESIVSFNKLKNELDFNSEQQFLNQYQSTVLDEAVNVLEQQKTYHSTAQPSQLVLPSKLQGSRESIQGTLDQQKAQIETRLINQMAKELDRKEQSSYQRHGMQNQFIYNASQIHLFNLVEHPQWVKLTNELQETYLTTLNDFNHQLVAQNYFIRNELRNKNAASSSQQQKTNNNNNASCLSGGSVSGAVSTNRRSDFMSTCIARVKNLFKSQQGILCENVKQLGHLKDENARLQEEVDKLRQSKGYVKDAQTVINEVVNKYFQMGHDQENKSERVKAAEAFLKTQSIAEVMDDEGHQQIAKMEYSNVLGRLQEMHIAMQMPSILNQGVKFDIDELTFDPDFSEKIRRLFADRFEHVQYDGALRALKMVFKDIKFIDFGVQADEGDIDNDLVQEVAFYKKETVRLMAEINQGRHKIIQSEKIVKDSNKLKNDAMLTAQAWEKQLKDTRQEGVQNTNELAKYKLMNSKYIAQCDQLISQNSKLTNQLDKAKRSDKIAEKTIDKLLQANDRKNALIKELDFIVEQLEGLASKEQIAKLQSVRALKEKVMGRDGDLRKAVTEYRKRDFSVDQKPSTKPGARGPNVSQLTSQEGNEADDIDQQMLDYERQKNGDPRGSVRRASKLTPAQSVGQKRLSTSKNSPGSGGGPQQQSQEKKAANSPRTGGDKKASAVGRKSSLKRADDNKHAAGSKAAAKGNKNAKSARKGVKFSDDQLNASNASSMNASGSYDAEDSDDQEASLQNIRESGDELSGLSRDSGTQHEGDDTLIGESGERRSSRKSSKKTAKHPSTALRTDRTDDGDSYENAHLEPPSISNFQNTADVKISRTSSKQGSYRNLKKAPKAPPIKVSEQSMQTDSEMFFQYIFDFLGELERRINSGEISIEDILAMGNDALCEKEEGKEGGNWRKYSTSPQKKQMYFSVQELKECLRRLKSLGSHGGDIFFAGIAKTMAAKPIVPQSFNKQHSFERDQSPVSDDDPGNEDIQATMDAAMLERQQLEELKRMTTTKRSIGGGSGFVKDSPPRKAERAQAMVQKGGTAPNSPFAKSLTGSASPSPINGRLGD